MRDLLSSKGFPENCWGRGFSLKARRLRTSVVKELLLNFSDAVSCLYEKGTTFYITFAMLK